MVPTALSLASGLILLIAVQLQVRRVEEPFLLGSHGQAYRDYVRVVGRFLPGIGRLS